MCGLFSVVHHSNPAEHVLSGDHHGGPGGQSTYDIAFGIDHNISNSMGFANFTSEWHATSGLDIPIGLVADEIMNSCRRKSVIGQVLQAVRLLHRLDHKKQLCSAPVNLDPRLVR